MAKPRDYKAEYQQRKKLGVERNLPLNVTRGHAKADQPSVSQLKKQGVIPTKAKEPRERKVASGYTAVRFKSVAEMTAWVESHNNKINTSVGHVLAYGRRRDNYPSGATREGRKKLLERNISQNTFTPDLANPSSIAKLQANIERMYQEPPRYIELKYKEF